MLHRAEAHLSDEIQVLLLLMHERRRQRGDNALVYVHVYLNATCILASPAARNPPTGRIDWWQKAIRGELLANVRDIQFVACIESHSFGVDCDSADGVDGLDVIFGIKPLQSVAEAACDVNLRALVFANVEGAADPLRRATCSRGTSDQSSKQ